MSKPQWVEKRQRWLVRFRWRIGTERFERNRYFTSKREAQRWARDMQAEVDAARTLSDRAGLLPVEPKQGPSSTASPTLTGFAPAFWTMLEATKASPSTIAGYKSHWRSVLQPVFGSLRVDEITSEMVDRFRLSREKQNRKPGPPLVCLSSMLTLAVDRGLIDRNPCHKGRTRRRTQAQVPDRPAPRTLTQAQLDAFLEAMETGRERVAVLLGGWAAMRLGEVRGLRAQDCHLDEGWIHVQRNVVRGTRGVLVERPPKSGRSRIIPIPKLLVDELRPWVAFPRPYVLADDRGRPMRGDGSRSALTRAIRKAQKEAEIPDPPLRFKDLRSTRATLWRDAGIPRSVIQAMMGHAVGASWGGDVLGQHYEGLQLQDLKRWVKG